METNSSGEDLVVKARKPYTITKQREKWTELEHNKFIEALKLYGRAWQRIEGHIGTKTAVQIRSHAQKFFTKLEKEAVMKGVPFGQTPDIEIPPPRPKRKPSSPYPRKTGAVSLSPSSETTDEKTSKSQSLLTTCKQSISSDNHAAWKIRGAKENSEEGSCSEVINLFQDVRAASNSSVSKDFSGFMALEKEMRDKATLKDNKDTKENGMVNTNLGSEEFKGAAILKPTDKIGQTDQSYANNAPVDFKKRNGDENVNVKPSLNPTIPSTSEMNVSSGTSSIHQSFQTFPPFGQLPTNQDAHKPFLNVSLTFWNVIMSTLLQNPAVHAAASVAASFWPSTGLDVSTASSSESIHGGLPTRHMNPNPSMAAIAAATVAAASAWWATQGLLPVYHPPLHTGFAFAPAPVTTIPIVDTAVAPNNKKEERGDDLLENSVAVDEQVVDPEQSGAVRASSSSDSGESGRVELTGGKTNKFSMDTGKARNTKKLDRSSCGSNTPSSSEVETDAVLKKQDGDKEVEPKQVQLNTNPPSVETSTRRNRSSTGIMYESWKEVSEEGRMAFQALFNREVLPQSFLPPDATESMLMATKNKGCTGELQVDLNVKASNEAPDVYHIHGLGGTTRKNSITSETVHGKQKVRRTGFKPYKRCSMEAKDSRATAGDEAGNKRIRLEGETPI